MASTLEGPAQTLAWPWGSVDCDHSECPAPGTHRVEAHGQDFYFCGHHLREMETVLDTVEWSTMTGQS